MKRLSLIILLSIPYLSYCQTKCDCFDRLYNLANVQKDVETSISIKKDAISFLDKTQKPEYYWEIGQAYNYIKKYDSAASYYKKAMEWGYDIESLKNGAQETYTRMDTNKLKKIALNFRKKIDFNLYDKFVTHEYIDQAIRNGTLFPKTKTADTAMIACRNAEIDSIFKNVDQSTFYFLKWVLEKYQFPTFHQLGFYPSGISFFLLHVTAYTNADAEYIFNKLDELNKSGNLPEKSKILFLKDRQKVIKDHKSYCGLFGTKRFENIEDICKADSIRFVYNRVRLKEEAEGAESGGGKLPLNYKPIPYPANYFCLKKYHIE